MKLWQAVNLKMTYFYVFERYSFTHAMSLFLSPSGRLATACSNGDILSAKAAIADGASVNDKARPLGWVVSMVPLCAAVYRRHVSVVIMLLYHGADPNGDEVMWWGALTAPEILQLLIDAGGDVNRNSAGRPPLFTAARTFCGDATVRVLLRHPSLDLTAKHFCKTAEQFARDNHSTALADMIAHEAARRAELTVLECKVWALQESYETVRRFDGIGRGANVFFGEACFQKVLRSLRFVWVSEFVAN